jgi:hypothetical protein
MSITNKFPQRTVTLALTTPVANTGAAVNSTVIDRLGYQSAKLIVNYAVVTGTPSAAVTALEVFSNSASSTSSPTPVSLVALETALDIMTAGIKEYDIDLSNAKRYIFTTWDATYTGGTTPGNIISAVLVLGDKSIQPANSATVYGR